MMMMTSGTPYHHETMGHSGGGNGGGGCQHIIRVDWAQGDRVCIRCGIVQEQHIMDMGPEWRDYGDRDDQQQGGGGNNNNGRSRCSMIPNDTTKYIGGLQPTTISRCCVQTSNSKHNNSNSKTTGASYSSRLIKINRQMDHRMERQHQVAVTNATWNIQLMRKQQQQHNLTTAATAHKVTTRVAADDTVTTTVHDDDDDAVPDYGSNVEWMEERPISDFEHLVLEQERQVAQQRQALYANKWSMDRAKQLYGTTTDSTTSNKNEIDTLLLLADKDETLRTAAQDLCTCYDMLVRACQTLQLPIAILDEAALLLSQYAARRDGLKVKGVASTTTMSTTTTTSAMVGKRWGQPRHAVRTTTKKTEGRSKEEINAQEQQQKIVLRDTNKLRQMASLCAAILFWMARYRHRPRTLMAVCDSVVVVPQQEKVSRKHCSRALNELKICFPELTRLSIAETTAAHMVVTTSKQLLLLLSKTCTTTRPSTSPIFAAIPAAICVQKEINIADGVSEGVTLSAVQSIGNMMEHILNKLHLPPVAEASIRYLIFHHLFHLHSFHESNDDNHNNNIRSITKLLPIRCAAFTYFVCHAGSTIQQLAKQAQTKTDTMNQANSVKKRLCIGSWSSRNDTKRVKHSLPDEVPFDLFTDHDPISASSGTVITGGVDGTISTSTTTATTNNNNNNSSIVLAEQRAYEMRRMWDAWSEQLSWDRSVVLIEQSTSIPRKVMIDYYKQHVFPDRLQLLQVLRDAIQDETISTALQQDRPTTTSTFLDEERCIMKKTPLASVLLSHILVAAPLLKANVNI
jgi:hypothetical protein